MVITVVPTPLGDSWDLTLLISCRIRRIPFYWIIALFILWIVNVSLDHIIDSDSFILYVALNLLSIVPLWGAMMCVQDCELKHR